MVFGLMSAGLEATPRTRSSPNRRRTPQRPPAASGTSSRETRSGLSSLPVRLSMLRSQSPITLFLARRVLHLHGAFLDPESDAASMSPAVVDLFAAATAPTTSGPQKVCSRFMCVVCFMRVVCFVCLCSPCILPARILPYLGSGGSTL